MSHRALGPQFFHLTNPSQRAGILTEGLRSARSLHPEEFEGESYAGDSEHVWFHGASSMTPPTKTHDVWELTHPEHYDLEEDPSEHELSHGGSYYKTSTTVRPEHLRLHQETA